MTTTELIDIVAKNSGTTKKQTSTTINEMLRIMVDVLKDGDVISLTGFGKESKKRMQPADWRTYPDTREAEGYVQGK